MIFVSCQSNTSKKELYAKPDTIAKVEVYYFHQKKGCITCKTIGELSKNFVLDNFGGKSKEVSYHDIDLSNKENQSLVDKFEVNWSGLYLLAHTAKGEVKDNLTEFAFLYAMTNHDTINIVMKNKINNFLKQ
ncbi:MAG: hypothetical protein AUJ97_06435 [Bacteroidetes bacterium CG2_30_32_10]|nr:MAG: hypothetical protein AUJ97_06435 [Bacteroidetes bacterium CG2_30_32_10]